MKRISALLLLLSNAGWATNAVGQPMVEISDTAACRCELQVSLALTLADADGRAGLASPQAMARLADGRFLVVPSINQGRVLLFDAMGSFERQIGRVGQGPGEYRAVLAIERTPTDSLMILDPANARVTVLDTSLMPARSGHSAQGGGQIATLSSGGVLLLGPISRTPLPRMHLLDAEFELVLSFMPEPPLTPDRGIAGLRRRMTATPDGLVAAAHTDEYVLEIWSVDGGTHVKTLRRRPQWFSSAVDQTDRSGPPPPGVGDPFFASDGTLWTTTFVPDERWDDARTTSLGPGITGVSQSDRDAYQDTVVEVLDVNLGVLLSSTRVDAVLRFMLDDGFAASYREDEMGNPFVDIWSLQLVER